MLGVQKGRWVQGSQETANEKYQLMVRWRTGDRLLHIHTHTVYSKCIMREWICVVLTTGIGLNVKKTKQVIDPTRAEASNSRFLLTAGLL